MKKKKVECVSNVRFESFEEGMAAQILYIGPYKDEAPVIKKCMILSQNRDTALVENIMRYILVMHAGQRQKNLRLYLGSLLHAFDK